MFNTSRSRAYRAILLVLGVVAACDDSVAPEQPAAASLPAAILSPPASARRFAFLPPLGDGAPENGVFDSTLAPVVEVCRLAPTGACDTAPLLARFERGPGGIQVHEHDGRRRDGDEAYYKVEWRPTAGTVDRWRVYRVRVLLGATELGHADVRFSSSDRDRDDDDRRRRSGGSDTARLTQGRPVPIAFWIERVPQRLTVDVGEGVIGWPPAGDTTYRHGARVFYAFLPAKGYENVEVALDGDSVPAFGTFTLDTARHLSVTVDRRVTLPAGTEQLFEQARGLLTASDPVAAYQDFVTSVMAYARGMDPDTAARRLGDMMHLAHDPVRDMEALVRLDAVLGGRAFRLDAPSSGAPGALMAAAAADDLEREPATVLYVNGIRTLSGTADVDAARIQDMMLAMPEFADAGRFPVHAVYNQTHVRGPLPPASEDLKKYCIGEFLARVDARILGFNSMQRYVNGCTRAGSSQADLLESARQMMSIDLDTDQLLPDAGRLADAIRKEQAAGRHVIVVAHSQGTLMANQAIHHLREVTEQWDPGRDSTCLAGIPLGAPTSDRWMEILPARSLFPIIVDGDFILELRDNDWPRISTTLSQRFRGVTGVLTPHEQLQLHFTDSYLTEDGAAGELRKGIRAVYNSCVVRSMRAVPASVTMLQGTGRGVGATPLNGYEETLFGRRLEWFSSNPAVATAIASGAQTANLFGVAPGSANAIVTSGGVTSVLPLVVQPRPLEIFPSAYRAFVPDGWGGDVLNCADQAPRPARTIELRFFREFGVERILVVVTQIHNGSQSFYFSPYIDLPGSPQGVDVRGNPTQFFRLRWNAERRTLSGEAEHQILRCSDGTRPYVIDPISFDRLP